MKKMLASLFVVVALFACVGVASAQTYTYNLSATGNPITEPGATGNWMVTVQQVGNTFAITNIAAGPGLPAGLAETEVSLVFFNTAGGTGFDNAVTLNGDGQAGVNSPADNNWGAGAYNLSNGFDWKTSTVPLTSSNTFAFDSTTNVSAPTAKSFSIEIQDGFQYFTGTIPVAPEASSLLLLLAAFAPLGLIAWRKRAALLRNG